MRTTIPTYSAAHAAFEVVWVIHQARGVQRHGLPTQDVHLLRASLLPLGSITQQFERVVVPPGGALFPVTPHYHDDDEENDADGCHATESYPQPYIYLGTFTKLYQNKSKRQLTSESGHKTTLRSVDIEKDGNTCTFAEICSQRNSASITVNGHGDSPLTVTR